jgi:hypothetical protein
MLSNGSYEDAPGGGTHRADRHHAISCSVGGNHRANCLSFTLLRCVVGGQRTAVNLFDGAVLRVSDSASLNRESRQVTPASRAKSLASSVLFTVVS